MSDNPGIAALARLIAEAKRAVVFTGAGISTESGIPDFRSPGGIWTLMAPIYFDEFLASEEARRETWRRRFAMEDIFKAAEPNRGHRAVDALVRRGKVAAVITQNIDNLHQSSGISTEHVIELHGNNSYALCLGCGKRYELSWVRREFTAASERAPDCECGGHIKTATISFGQQMPEREMRRAEQLTLDCDLFLAVGSSLVVWPAAGFPQLAKRNGARLVIINREATEFDEIADLVIRQDIGTVLSPFVIH